MQIHDELPLVHLVARTSYRARPFLYRIACADLWQRIRRHFDVLACVLMPNHLHLLTPLDRKSGMRIFAQILSAFRMQMRATDDLSLRFHWETIPEPQKVQTDRNHIARTIRYIHLNPVRAGLCNDPLEWEWSTHRDWIGAVAQPAVDRIRWSRMLEKSAGLCADWLHDYVSSDESVIHKKSLIAPAGFLDDMSRDASVDSLIAAIPRALRSPRTLAQEFNPTERKLFVKAATRWTRYPAAELARQLGRHPTSAQRTLRKSRELTPNETYAIAQILTDQRLQTMPLDIRR